MRNKILIVLIPILFFCGIKVFSQAPVSGIYLPVNVTTYGGHDARRAIDSALGFPTGSGVPSSLQSSYRGLAMLRYDSTNGKCYVYNPKSSVLAWELLGGLSPSDTVGIRPQLFSGTNINISGSYPTLTINAINLWKDNGNSGTTAGTNFIGTSDAVEFVGKYNSLERIRLRSAGTLFDGTRADVAINDNSDNAINITTANNTTVRYNIQNTSSGGSAAAGFVALNDAGEQAVIQSTSSTYTGAGARPHSMLIHANTDSGMQINSYRAYSGMFFGVGLTSPSLTATNNVMTIVGGTGNIIMQNGTFNPVDSGRKLQVIGAGSFSDTLFAFGKVKFTGLLTTAQAYIGMFDTDGNMYKVDTTGLFGGGTVGGLQAVTDVGDTTDNTITITGGVSVLSIEGDGTEVMSIGAEEVTAYMRYKSSANGNYTIMNQSLLTGNRTYNNPDVSGTLALGTGAANQIGYWSGTNTLGALSTATYPNLTELSYVKGVTSAIQTQFTGKQDSDGDLTAIAALSPSNDDVIQRKAGAWTNRTMAQIKTDLVLVKSDVGLSNVDNTSNATERAATATLTNKRITSRVGTTASSATPTPDADAHDIYTVTALAADATFAAPTGTPTEGQSLLIRIEDNGTARALAWNAIYRAGTDISLPTTTVLGKIMYIQYIFHSGDTKWDLVGLTEGF